MMLAVRDPQPLQPASRQGRKRLFAIAALTPAALLLVACSTSVNQALIATSTPYPVRSPVSAAPSVAAFPSPVAAALATGEAALAGGEHERATAAFGTAIALAPQIADGYVGRAAARVDGGDLVGARADLDRALALAPDRAELYLARAQIEARLPDLAAAAADFGRAIAANPSSHAAFVGRGDLALLTAQGDPARYRAALDDYNRALALAPSDVSARLGRARVAADRAEFRGDPADWDRALNELDQATDAANDPVALALRARLLAAKGDSPGAQTALAAADGALPPAAAPATRARIETARATVALEARDWNGAIAAATAALTADPAAWDASRVLADAEIRRGGGEAALAATDALLAKLPTDGRARYLTGLALASLGRIEDARAALDRARATLPESPVYQAKITEALDAF